jgi:hypothetical protein
MKVARTGDAVKPQILDTFDTSKRLHKENPFVFVDTQLRVCLTLDRSNSLAGF